MGTIQIGIVQIVWLIWFVLGVGYFSYFITRGLRDKYWKGILAARKPLLCWDAEPACPSCGHINEYLVDLEDDGKEYFTYCTKCKATFPVHTTFELTVQVGKKITEEEIQNGG